MNEKSGLGFMMAFVQKYLDDEIDRLGFDLDFNHYLNKHYSKLEREIGELADCFSFYLTEEGIDQTDGLSDAGHKKLIRKQYKEFKAAMSDELQ